MADLRLTIGELGFAVGVASTLDRGLGLVRSQLGITSESEARTVLTTSGHSLVARELVASGTKALTLAPALQPIAEIVAAAQWTLRLVRTLGKRAEVLAFHLAPAGVVARAADGEVVHRVATVPGVAGLVARAESFFDLPPLDDEPGVPLSRAAIDDLARLPEHADIAAALRARGAPDRVAAPFAAALAAPRWRGTVARIHTPRHEHPRITTMIALVAGGQRWMIENREPDTAVLGLGSRQRFAAAIKTILRTLDATTRSFDRAGELAAPPLAEAG